MDGDGWTIAYLIGGVVALVGGLVGVVGIAVVYFIL